MALLVMLSEMSAEDGFPLYAAHVDHGIRGEEAVRDRLFCKQEAQRYGVELFLLEADVPRLAEAHGTGLEEEARRVRYDFFATLMEEKRIPILVTAHHADDNLETVLFRMCRGSALGGLGGIAPVRAFAVGFLVRPLLNATKEDLVAYCHARGLDYVCDSTNADTAYTRNAIRHNAVPALLERFPDAQRRVCKTCEELREDERLLQSLAEQFLEAHTTPYGLSTEALRQAPIPIRSRAIDAFVCRRIGATLERIHLERIAELIRSDRSDRRVSLPQGFFAIVERGALTALSGDRFAASELCILCELDAECERNGCAFGLESEKKTKVHNLSTPLYINSDSESAIIKGNLFWRSRRPGDRILMGGMHRKLRRLYAAIGIPPRLRERIPLLCDEEGIVWAPMVGLRDGLPHDGVRCTAYLTLPHNEEWNVCLDVETKGKGQKDVSN